MGFNFPSSPAVGAFYPASPVAGQPQYRWDGEKWKAAVLADSGVVHYDVAQTLSGAQQTQARSNIGAGVGSVTNILTGAGLAGGPISGAGTISRNYGENANNSFPGNPTGTASGTGVMMGIGAGAKFAPSYSSRLFVIFSGYFTSGFNISGTINGKYGSGTPPANGAAPQGNPLGNGITGTIPAANYCVPFCLPCIAVGLTPGTVYWFDLLLSTGSGNVISLQGVNFSGFEF